MAFVEHALAGDPTNWWVPIASAVEAMLRTTGTRVVDRPGHEIWVCQRQRATYHRDEIDAATGRCITCRRRRGGRGGGPGACLPAHHREERGPQLGFGAGAAQAVPPLVEVVRVITGACRSRDWTRGS